MEVLPYLDFDELASSEATWLVGYSDLSTLMLALTTLTGIATVHSQNLMDTAYRREPGIHDRTRPLAHAPGRLVRRRECRTGRTYGRTR
ncbi:MAG: LD-carboxypeptidase [Actinomycetota bacterium]|nr:LD-carboxypeptidase [Actinomycetota bacterium]